MEQPTNDELQLAPQYAYGIELRPWERQRLTLRQEKLPDILDRILLQGLRVKMRLFEDASADPSDRDYAILNRTRQVLAAAHQTVLIQANCSARLLHAHGFITPHTSSLLPELDDWM